MFLIFAFVKLTYYFTQFINDEDKNIHSHLYLDDTMFMQ